MVQALAGDADGAIAHLGEIGQAEPARRMVLPENDVPLGTVQRPPGADAPLQRAPDTGANLAMAAPDLVENGDRPQARGALEQRHHLAVPNRGQRVRPPAVARRFLLRRQPGSCSRRSAVATLNPALAAAMTGGSLWRKLMNNLVRQSVMWRPGKGRFLIGVKTRFLSGRPRPPANTPLAGPRRSPGSQPQSGYALLA